MRNDHTFVFMRVGCAIKGGVVGKCVRFGYSVPSARLQKSYHGSSPVENNLPHGAHHGLFWKKNRWSSEVIYVKIIYLPNRVHIIIVAYRGCHTIASLRLFGNRMATP